MNAPKDILDKRQSSRVETARLTDDFQNTEARVIEKTKEMFSGILEAHYPVLCGMALMSRNMKGKLTVEITYDLTPGKKAIEMRPIVQPPVVTSLERCEVKG